MTKTKSVKATYAAMPGGVLNRTKAQVAGRELDRIARKYGCIKPQLVVEASRPTSAPLHNEFTWDNGKAAELWRLEEASHIIRAVRIIQADIPEAEQPTIRAFHNVQASDKETRFKGRGYVTIQVVSESEDYQQQVLNRAREELNQWQRRYSDYRSFFKGVFEAIDEVK